MNPYACLICGSPVADYEPVYCCSGIDCSCYGLPTEPPLCSKKCAEELYRGQNTRPKREEVMDKPTLEQVAWIFEQINENTGCSFRKLIYDRLGFGPNAYSELFSAGGQIITNAMALEFYAFDPEKNLDDSRREIIDSLMAQIEVLRPVYEAAKVMQAAYDHATTEGCVAARKAVFHAVDAAARELEDSDE